MGTGLDYSQIVEDDNSPQLVTVAEATTIPTSDVAVEVIKNSVNSKLNSVKNLSCHLYIPIVNIYIRRNIKLKI